VGVLEQIAYEAALRALDKQESLVSDVRSRAGLLLGSASIAASFLAQAGASHLLFATALGSFMVLVGAALRVLLPTARLGFTLSGAVVYERLRAARDDPAEVYRELLYEADRLWGRNDLALRPVFRAYQLAGFALAVETLSLVLLATGTIL
jgi:hypothetical protein